MKLEITVTEVKEIFKSLHEHPEQLFEMMRSDIQQAVAAYLDAVMRTELTDCLGRERYQRTGAPSTTAMVLTLDASRSRESAMWGFWCLGIAGETSSPGCCLDTAATSMRSAGT